ncbi:uncharacterized protein LOC113565532 [Drosophila persimilis]|uniref:Mitochondrial import receptor subunit TOM5 homolog n=1 Tax=Drosophila pseudoobscura pseudoobscura TaxID=46245 RepID=A0A6I8VZC6_DROPS|nr:uncharacterized protein LOC113565532 [Drosophila persimilis]XP_033235864.1 uncharacterized protein LOC117184023 [Drosophila pseudoobscura]
MIRALQPDMRAVEELAKKEVQANIFVFVLTCALIRFVPKIIRKFF